MKMLSNYVTLAIAIAALTGTAHAIPQLRISDGTSTITITDGGAGDGNAAAGAVTWIGAIGVWTINVDTGITKPIIGNSGLPILDLNFVDVSSSGGTLTVTFTETDFNTFGVGRAYMEIGGTAAGSVTYSAYGGNSNLPFDTTRLLGTIGPLGPQAFSSKLATGIAVAGTGYSYDFSLPPYSLTQVVTITHPAAGISSGNAYLRVPETGMSISLLAAGLISLGLVSRLRPRHVRTTEAIN